MLQYIYIVYTTKNTYNILTNNKIRTFVKKYWYKFVTRCISTIYESKVLLQIVKSVKYRL